jgi:hypothetical protein
MKRIRHLYVFLMIMLITSSCFLQKKIAGPAQVIKPLSDTVILRDGSLVYALPRSVFTIRIEMERIINIPGPYARYAGDLLGLENVIMSQEEQWSVRSVSVNSHEEADPSEFYVIESSTNIQSNVLALKKEGLILDLNPESDYQVPVIPDGREINVNQFRSYDLGSDEYYFVQTDTAYRRVSVDSKFIRIPYIVEKKKKLTTEQLAERAARRLMELREGMFMILTGEANVFPQDNASINEINRMEEELTELFTGKTIVDIRTFTYHFIPEKDLANKPVEILKFSEATGPEEVNAKNGMPVIMELVPEQKTKDLSLITRAQTEGVASGSDKIYYRIPDVVNVRISMDKETLYSSRKLICQFGEVMQLPANYIIAK